MNEQEVICRQATKLERLEAENAHLKECISRALLHIICIGGPLNDNKLGYSKEQLYTFHRIKDELDASTGGTMELVLIRGLPGSGKTTMARVLALVGYEHHEADHYFERDGAYKFDPADLPKAHAWCLERAKNSIARGARCVVANTFTRRWEMQPYMDAAKAAGVPVRVIEARGEWANCHGVPADAIERMRARWEFVNA